MIGGVTDWILSLGEGWALAVIFLGPALESSAFVGFLFPGEIAVVLGGVLAYQGTIPLGGAIAAAIAGAVVGDTIGFWVGRRWGRQLLRWLGSHVPFVKERIDDHLDRASAYLKRRGGLAVFVGRFTAALRVMVPGLAGMAEMHYPTFFAFNVAGGIVWGSGFVLLGYFAGAAWERVASYAGYAGFGLLAIVLVGIVATRVVRDHRERGATVADRAAAVRPVAWLRRRYPRTSAWLGGRVDTSNPRGFVFSVAALVAVLAAWAFGGLTQDVVAREHVVGWDPGVTRFVVDHRLRVVTDAMRIVTWLGSNAVLIPLVVITGLYLTFRGRDARAAVVLVLSLAGAAIFYDAVKAIVGRSRPPVGVALMHATGSAFPSGHATASAAVYAALAMVVVRHRRAPSALAWIVAACVVAAVGFSRVYLGVHWLTDVLAGWSLGVAWACVLSMALFLWPRAGARG